MKIVKANISVFTVPITVKIRNMEVSEEEALQFDLSEANSVRKAINRVQKEPGNKEFTTATTDNHTLVWRTK